MASACWHSAPNAATPSASAADATAASSEPTHLSVSDACLLTAKSARKPSGRSGSTGPPGQSSTIPAPVARTRPASPA